MNNVAPKGINPNATSDTEKIIWACVFCQKVNFNLETFKVGSSSTPEDIDSRKKKRWQRCYKVFSANIFISMCKYSKLVQA